MPAKSIRNGIELVVARRSRKERRCETKTHVCVKTIYPGERYAYSSLPPWSEISNERWWHHTTCVACVNLYHPEIAKQLFGT
ncbi:hypothetical protein [Actinoplanes sp. NPDC048796]|uniref:hypothetical protein n=1 Tax=Actinoplanes sp. NPDC048796 TaxID=3155640 RepID=UPI00340D88FC